MRSRPALEHLPRIHRRSRQLEVFDFRAEGTVCVMLTTCGQPKVNGICFNHLRELGKQIHASRQPLAFDGGFVGFNEELESEVNANAETHPGRGSQAQSRKGWRKPRRSRSSGQAKPFSARAVEDAYGAGFRFLAQHYKALSFEEEAGLWVAVRTRPLGRSGPQAHLLIGLPVSHSAFPKAWAFSQIGPNARLFPLKHTNFPDASICAFTKESGAWAFHDGILPLVDHYSLWVLKSWHRSVVGWWPGPQVGACALYRRKEFVANEWCGCESGKLYGDCHQFLDNQMPESKARGQFKRMFGVDYENRCAPQSVLEAARSKWKLMPDVGLLL